MVKNLPANAGDIKRCEFGPWVGKIPWRRAWQPTPVFLPGESHGWRGAWQVTVHSVTKGWTQLKWLSVHTTLSITSILRQNHMLAECTFSLRRHYGEEEERWEIPAPSFLSDWSFRCAGWGRIPLVPAVLTWENGHPSLRLLWWTIWKAGRMLPPAWAYVFQGIRKHIRLHTSSSPSASVPCGQGWVSAELCVTIWHMAVYWLGWTQCPSLFRVQSPEMETMYLCVCLPLWSLVCSEIKLRMSTLFYIFSCFISIIHVAFPGSLYCVLSYS